MGHSSKIIRPGALPRQRGNVIDEGASSVLWSAALRPLSKSKFGKNRHQFCSDKHLCHHAASSGCWRRTLAGGYGLRTCRELGGVPRPRDTSPAAALQLTDDGVQCAVGRAEQRKYLNILHLGNFWHSLPKSALCTALAVFHLHLRQCFVPETLYVSRDFPYPASAESNNTVCPSPRFGRRSPCSPPEQHTVRLGGQPCPIAIPPQTLNLAFRKRHWRAA